MGFLAVPAYGSLTEKSIFSKCLNLSIFSLMNTICLCRLAVKQFSSGNVIIIRVMIKLQCNSVNLRIPGAESLTLLCGEDDLRSQIFTQLDKCDSCLSHSTEKEGGIERRELGQRAHPQKVHQCFIYSAATESLYFI